MAIKHSSHAGFALLIAIIFMSVMLAFGVALAALGYKQQVLASNSISSQYAFYAADSGLECALYYDQQENLFAYETADGNAKAMTCGGVAVSAVQQGAKTAQQVIFKATIPLDSDTRCVDVWAYKPPAGSGIETQLFSQGYDAPCSVVASISSTRFAARGILVHY